MRNSLYSTQESNTKFHIIDKDLSYNAIETEVYSIPEDNYNVFEMLTNYKFCFSILNQLLTIQSPTNTRWKENTLMRMNTYISSQIQQNNL